MLDFHSILADAGTALGAATGIAALLRIDELWLATKSRAWLVSALLTERSEKKEVLVKLSDQHVGHVALTDTVQALKLQVESLEGRMEDSEADRQHLHGILAELQPRFDGAIAYIHALTAWGLRLVRALRSNRIDVGIDENLPKPPDLLLKYVPEAHRPPE